MPDLITHYLFAQEIINDLKKELILNHLATYNLGSSGPDYFFYYHILPYSKKKNRHQITQFGHMMHNKNIDQFFEESFIYLKENYSDTLYSYFIGYLTHYFLDRKAHPYIFYFSGVQNHYPETKIYEYWHKRFEVCIDEKMLNEIAHTDIKHFHPATIVNVKEIEIQTIYNYTAFLIKKTYQQNIEFYDLKQSIYDFRQALKLLYSKYSYKKRLVLQIEKVFKIPPQISTAMYSIKEENYDFLNIKKQEWLDPCNQNIKHNESFIELYEEAKIETVHFIKQLDLYLNNKLELKELMKTIDGKCFDTNYREGIELKYSRCIYEYRDVLKK